MNLVFSSTHFTIMNDVVYSTSYQQALLLVYIRSFMMELFRLFAC